MEGYELDTCPPDEFEDAFGGFGGDDLLLYRELLADGDGHDAMSACWVALFASAGP